LLYFQIINSQPHNNSLLYLCLYQYIAKKSICLELVVMIKLTRHSDNPLTNQFWKSLDLYNGPLSKTSPPPLMQT